MDCPRRGAECIASIAPRDGASVIPECRWYEARRGQKGSSHASDAKGYWEQERRFWNRRRLFMPASWRVGAGVDESRLPARRRAIRKGSRPGGCRIIRASRRGRCARTRRSIGATRPASATRTRLAPSARAQEVTRLTLRRDRYKSPLAVVICENDRGRSWYVCGQARYGREPQLRAPSPLCARRVRDDGPPDGDDARRRGGERRRGGDAHPPDASVTVPFRLLLPESEQS